MLDASIVGSLPKPSWLAQPGVLKAPWRLSGPELRHAQDDAVRLAILEQEEAGLSTLTDGEQRRRADNPAQAKARHGMRFRKA